MKKTTNPYEKKEKKSFRITRKQWIAALSVLGAIAILVGIVLMGRFGAKPDPHAGHNHAPGEGHTDAAHSETSKVKYSFTPNGDNTYRLVVRNDKGAPLFEKDKLYRPPVEETINEEAGIYALGWPTDMGPNDFEYIFYNKKTGDVSQLFVAPRGYDGVRVAYGSEDQTKVIVQDIFGKNGYYKEYKLEGAYKKAENIIIGGRLSSDKKSVSVTYVVDKKGATKQAVINLYE